MASDNIDVVATTSAAVGSVVGSLLQGAVSSVAVVVTCTPTVTDLPITPQSSII